MSGQATFPKIIYSLWFQGIENAPSLVRRNLERWTQLNPGYRLVILDAETSVTFLADLPIDPSRLSIQAQSDIIRLCILHRHGGIWADATVFPIKPLDLWLPKAASQSDFFAYERDGVVLPLSSWFLAAQPNALIVHRWYETTLQYWSVERQPLQQPGEPLFVPDDPSAIMALNEPHLARPYPYFWLHHLFGMLIETDTNFREEWAKRLRKSATGPHMIAEFYRRTIKPVSPTKRLLRRLRRSYSQKRIMAAVKNQTEMQKLDWRIKYPQSIFDSLL